MGDCMENHILMLPEMFVNADDNVVKMHAGHLDYRKLLINSLYWDKIILTNNNIIHVGYDGSPGVLELKKEGILYEEEIKIFGRGNIGTILYDGYMDYLIESLSREDFNIVANDVGSVLIKNGNNINNKNGELLTLINAIPEPDPSVNIHEALEFRLKRRHNLKNLMDKLNELNSRILTAENKDQELKKALKEIDTACSEVIKLYGESKIKFNLSEVKLNFNLPEIATNVGAAYFGSKAIGLPETASVIAATAYGINTMISFSGSISLRDIDKLNPFNYVGEMSIKLN